MIREYTHENFCNAMAKEDTAGRDEEERKAGRIVLVRDTNYPDMYRLRWPDGVISEDMYNLTRAKDHKRNEDLKSKQNRVRPESEHSSPGPL